MQIKSAEYIGSYVHLEKCPEQHFPEYAFIGRSNVGKSSLINYLCERKALAKVSVTPGKTQTLNFFLINQTWHLVDLPGYGYAKISKRMRETWSGMIKKYVRERKQLQYVFQLVDGRISPQKIDIDFAGFLGENGIPFVIVFTKCDKLNSPETQKNIAAFKQAMSEQWEELPPMFTTSSDKKIGRESIMEFIEAANAAFR